MNHTGALKKLPGRGRLQTIKPHLDTLRRYVRVLGARQFSSCLVLGGFGARLWALSSHKSSIYKPQGCSTLLRHQAQQIPVHLMSSSSRLANHGMAIVTLTHEGTRPSNVPENC